MSGNLEWINDKKENYIRFENIFFSLRNEKRKAVQSFRESGLNFYILFRLLMMVNAFALNQNSNCNDPVFLCIFCLNARAAQNTVHTLRNLLVGRDEKSNEISPFFSFIKPFYMNTKGLVELIVEHENRERLVVKISVFHRDDIHFRRFLEKRTRIFPVFVQEGMHVQKSTWSYILETSEKVETISTYITASRFPCFGNRFYIPSRYYQVAPLLYTLHMWHGEPVEKIEELSIGLIYYDLPVLVVLEIYEFVYWKWDFKRSYIKQWEVAKRVKDFAANN